MKKDKIKILVVGAGGVGAYFSGRLAQHGADVSVVCRSDFETVSKNGFDIKSIKGDFTFTPASVHRSAAEYEGVPDYIFLTTKVLADMIDPAELIAPAVHPGTAIVMIQNGIDIEHPVHNAFPDNPLITSIAYIGVFRDAPGMITHQGGGTIALGNYPEGISPESEKLSAMFKDAGIECEVSADMRKLRWKKLLWNIPFNALSVCAGSLDTAEIMSDPNLEKLAESVMREIVQTAHENGVDLEESLVQWNLDYTKNFPPYKTSMLLDHINKRPMEVEAILGNFIRIAEKSGTPVPKTTVIYYLLSAIDRKNRQ